MGGSDLQGLEDTDPFFSAQKDGGSRFSFRVDCPKASNKTGSTAGAPLVPTLALSNSGGEVGESVQRESKGRSSCYGSETVDFAG